MKKTIVNLVSEQTIPNFLFIKEMINIEDELLFISSKKFEDRIEWIVNALEYKNCKINTIVLPEGVEEKWQEMIGSIKNKLVKGEKYIVNLTCGTKFMISAVPKAFNNFDTEFYYIPFPKNVILKIGENFGEAIKSRISVTEYFKCNNTQIPSEKETSKSEDYTKSFFEKFVKNEIDFKVIEKLRLYRNKNIIDIEKVEREGLPKSGSKEYPAVPGLATFLRRMDFRVQLPNQLTKYEIQYLTGGWFEDYTYFLIKDNILVNDIKLGVRLPISENKSISNRDLDVVFTYENKLFVIECKTGIDEERMLNETVYKIAALKNERLGKLSAYTSIFSLSGENEKFKDIAKAMNITYYDRFFFNNEGKFNSIMSDINKKAKG